MVTTPRLGVEEEGALGLREWGRILSPVKSPETLPPVNGDRKLVDKEEAFMLLLLGERVRGGKKCEQQMVATSIAYCKNKIDVCFDLMKSRMLQLGVLSFGSGHT